MKIAESLVRNIEKNIEKEINLCFTDLFVEYDEILNTYIEKEKNTFLQEKKEKIKKNFPYNKDIDAYEKFLESEKSELSKVEVEQLEDISLKVGVPFQKKWWTKKLIKKNLQERKSLDEDLKNLLESEWGRNLNFLVGNWELEKTTEIKEEIVRKFKNKIERIKELKDIISLLDLDSGIFWDLTERSIINTDIKTLMEWTKYLKDNKEVKELCDLLGKIKVFNEALEEEKLSKREENIAIPRINSRDEISRVKLGNTIEAVLASELSLLNDSNLEILFDLKFLENKLMMYDFQGSENIKKEITDEINKSEEIDGKGPVIICLDTSGSMSGSREKVAKALCFSLISKAVSEKRECLLINFSIKIETMVFSKLSKFSEILEFLKKSFYGGTDAVPALSYSLDMLEKEKYKQADILMISDFLLETVDETVEARIKKAKRANNKFYSIAIGNLNMEQHLKDLFSKQWSYNPKTASIKLLNEIIFEYDSK